MTIQLIYNPNCSKSIKTLEIIKNHGIEPKLLYYLEEDLSKKFLISKFSEKQLQLSKSFFEYSLIVWVIYYIFF